MNTSRRGFLTSMGKASAVAGVTAIIVRPEPEVREVTNIVEKQVVRTVVSYERKPRPDLSGLPIASLKKEEEGQGYFAGRTITATGPLGESHLHHGSGVTRHDWNWRWDDNNHGQFETTLDQMSVKCGACVDEDDFYRLCFGDRAYARRLAKRAWRLGAREKAQLLMTKYRLARWLETGEPK